MQNSGLEMVAGLARPLRGGELHVTFGHFNFVI